MILQINLHQSEIHKKQIHAKPKQANPCQPKQMPKELFSAYPIPTIDIIE